MEMTTKNDASQTLFRKGRLKTLKLLKTKTICIDKRLYNRLIVEQTSKLITIKN